MGVKPAVNTIQKSYCEYIFCISKKDCCVKEGMLLKKKFAIPENSFGDDHQRKCPMAYPASAPVTEAIVQVDANLNALLLAPSTSAISNASGGMGKKDDSAKANIKSAIAP